MGNPPLLQKAVSKSALSPGGGLLIHFSGLPAAYITLRHSPKKEWLGLCILGTTSNNVQECSESTAVCLPNIRPYIFLVELEYLHEYITPSAILINLTNRLKLCLICPVQNIIKATLNRTSSSNMRPMHSIGFNHVAQGPKLHHL